MPVEIRWTRQTGSKENCFKISTSVGVLCVYQVDNVITKTEWCFEPMDPLAEENRQSEQIRLYLENPVTHLTVKLLKQGSEFRNRVWDQISNIPTGQVISYSELASQIDSGARAVANACRDNPFPVLIPCHRVVSASGLGGYMGKTSGREIEIKKKLLAKESLVF